MRVRVATFNVENLDDGPDLEPSLEDRVRIMRPQLERVRADILCLQEVHSQGISGERTFSALDALLAGTVYSGYNRVATRTTGGEPYDARNLVTLSRFPIVEDADIRDSAGPRPSYKPATAIPEEPAAEEVEWERPLLYTRIDLCGTGPLHLVNVHLKSKIASTIAGQKLDRYTWRSVSAWAEGSFVSSMKRVGQALQARLFVDQTFDRHGLDALIAVCGDFNAETHEVPVRAICGPVEETGNPEHAPRLLVPCENTIPDSARYSLLHLGRGCMLDHIIVSRPLLRYFRCAEIHNEALPDESGAFRGDTKFPESDHAPVVAEFGIPEQ
jgi:endonuclease/exonuclease/phosphatase family metal-dependent hydrolase